MYYCSHFVLWQNDLILHTHARSTLVPHMFIYSQNGIFIVFHFVTVPLSKERTKLFERSNWSK